MYTQRVHLVMDHVRTHLTDDLSLDDLAGIAGFSPFHFHRIFKGATGETLTAYRRRCRLERAAYLMKASPGKALGTIALDSGFSSPSDFSRVFRTAYGIAPSAWDRVSALHAANDLGDVDGEGPGRFGRPDPPIDVTVRHHSAVRIAYVRLRDPFRGTMLADGYRQLGAWLASRGVSWRSAALFGISWDNYDATPLRTVRFDLGFEVGPDVHPVGEIGVLDVPAVRSVDAHSAGPLLRVAQAWDHLYLEWLPSSGYEPDDLPAMQRFRRHPADWTEWDVDCCIALRPLRR